MPQIESWQHTDQSRSPGRVNYLLLLVAFAWCVYWFIHAWHYWEDDAFIHLEFARSVASGQGFAFNGHVAAGDTAPLWVLLLAAIHVVIPQWIVAGKTLAAIGAAFGLGGVYAFARRLASQMTGRVGIFPAALVLLIVVSPSTCYWLFCGLETLTATGLACFIVLAATRARPTAASFLTACALIGVGPLLRPEMSFLALLLVLPLWGQAKQLTRNRAFITISGLFLLTAPLVLWSVYSLHAFGHLLPNTNAAKRAGPEESVILRLVEIYCSGFPIIACGAMAAGAALSMRTSAVRDSFRASLAHAGNPPKEIQPRAALPLAGWIFVLWAIVANVFYIANHTHVQTRYVFIQAPALVTLILLLALRFSKSLGRLIYVGGFAVATVSSLMVTRPLVRNKGILCDRISQYALYIRNNLPPQAPVAIFSIGQVAFISQHPIIDTGGIVRPDSLPYLKAHPGQVVQWAQSVGAQYYIDSHSPEDGAVPVYTTASPFIGWTYHLSQYATITPFAIWKLPPTAPPTPPAQAPAAINH